MENTESVKPNDRIKVGFTWYTVLSVQGDTVHAAEPFRMPRKFVRGDIREVEAA